jgi:hypothetical protein
VTIVSVHADGTDCAHPGHPVMATPDSPAVCPAGQLVDRVRIDGRLVGLTSVVTAVVTIGGHFAEAITPFGRGLVQWAGCLCDDPAFRAVAAAAGALSTPWAAPAAEVLPPPVPPDLPGDAPPMVTGEPPIDPCGGGPIGAELPGQLALPLRVPDPGPAGVSTGR